MSLTDAAAAGLSAAEQTLSTVGQNLANANTMGYKASAPIFQQLYEQTLQGGTAPTATFGGTNPQQVAAGSGVGLAGMQVDQSEGSIKSTGVASNLAISGNGYFLVKTSSGTAYRRSGDFSLNANGTLVDANGDRVQGWGASTVKAGTQSKGNLSTINIPVNSGSMNPTASTKMTLSGNLNATAVGTSSASSTTKDVPVTMYDSQGNPVAATLKFSDPRAVSGGGVKWSVNLYPSGSSTPYSGSTGTTITFATGKAPAWNTSPSWTISPTDGSSTMTIHISTNDIANLTSHASSNTASATADGSPSGTLRSYSVGKNGVVTGTYSNGQTQTLGQVALATVPNRQGMQMSGNNNFTASPNAGTVTVGQAGSGAFGSIVGGSLEGSNVSMARQFTSMIGAQEHYGADAKLLTAAQQDNTALVGAVQ